MKLNIDFSNRGVMYGTETRTDPCMLLSPLGKLLHTSILDYTILFVITLF